MNRIALFTSFYFATSAEKAMRKAAIPTRLISTPPALKHACGLCLLFGSEHLADFLAALRENNISHSGIYTYDGPTGKSEKIQIEMD